MGHTEKRSSRQPNGREAEPGVKQFIWEGWEPHLMKLARKYNLRDPEHRASFRTAVEGSFDGVQMDVMHIVAEFLGVPRGVSRTSASRIIADAIIIKEIA